MAAPGFRLVEGIRADADQLASYQNCPPDPHQGGISFRRFSQLRVDWADWWRITPVSQRVRPEPKDFGSGGGYRRDCPPLEADFSAILLRLVEELGLDTDTIWQLRIHQNRTVVEPGRGGLPARAGRRRHGYEFVSLSVFDRQQVTGGETRLWADDSGSTPRWRHTLMPGQTLLLDDRALWHDTTELKALGNRPGTRDVLAVAYARLPGPGDRPTAR